MDEGWHLRDRASVDRLDQLRPHFARAGMVSAQLGLEQARATVSALETIGLPAAVMTASGRVLTANGLLEEMTEMFLPTAYGGMAIANASANALFQQAILENRNDFAVRSTPVAANESRPAVVIHLLPLRRAAHDIFAGADILVAATEVRASAVVPSPALLAGLFDLTPSEARLAAALSQGRPLKAAASDLKITVKTGRTYLERIFAKTGDPVAKPTRRFAQEHRTAQSQMTIGECRQLVASLAKRGKTNRYQGPSQHDVHVLAETVMKFAHGWLGNSQADKAKPGDCNGKN
ncbi:hypothetical protein MES4922_490039 [Mesorhizobium ventifaucium]|uniref:HTH luxR-type domain-containing protein n=1 Tax=Mesorhizobium ventifaucium TaxID=666020 RepID=A0ABM9EAJ5_9HYPH|nr:hypothetical protein MES4922_490039 [Mesorhizobium ventifaucium]